MIEKKLICIGIILFFIYFSINHISADHNLYVGDNYNFDQSSKSDHVAFVNYNFNFQSTGLDLYDPGLVCYDWDFFNNEGQDDCYYENSEDRDYCIACYWPSPLTPPSMHYINHLTDKINNKICDNCEYDTSTRFSDSVGSYVYYNCDQCEDSYVGSTGEKIFVIQPRQYLCEHNGDDRFIVRGEYPERPYLNLEWTNYDSKYCSDLYDDYYGCSKNKDEISDNTGTTILPNPCAIKDGDEPGNICSYDDECISNNCLGAKITATATCDSDGSQGYDVYYEYYESTCGGEGTFDYSRDVMYNCSLNMGGNNNYVCDSDLASLEGAPYSPTTLCKLKEYASCNADSECWNNNGGYNCMGGSGNKICTTGANEKNCYNNDNAQCDSFRCDNTCQSKLANGQGCDENSDCINGQCSGGTCGGSGVVVDLAIVKIEPIQVIKDVDLVKGKFGIVRVTVTNYGSNQSDGRVNVTFDGNQLDIADGDTSTKPIPPNRNITFDFEFTPTSSGDNKEIIANVSVV